jgi:hypothetical protein
MYKYTVHDDIRGQENIQTYIVILGDIYVNFICRL